jgi:hypothetical protein
VGCVVCLSVVKVPGRFGVEGPKTQIAGRKVNFWKKAKGILSGPFFKHRYIFLILTVAFLRHIIKIVYLFD